MAITDRYHILRALADGEERHGYTIMEAVEAATGGKVLLPPGTLYRAIARMLEDGLIVEEAPRPAPDLEDERRRYYRITPRGQALLANPGVPLVPLAPVAPPASVTPLYQSPPHRQRDVLRVLADGQERHGVAIMLAVGRLPGAAFLGPTGLHYSLRYLLRDSLIVQSAPRPAPDLRDDAPREYYRITPQGEEALRTPGVLPLPPRTAVQEGQYDVLCALADSQERHAYGLIRAVRAAHDGAVRFGTATVYRTLDALLADGLVVETGERVDPAVNPRAPRRHFRITPRGQDAHRMLAAREPHQPRGAVPWRGALSFGVTWGAATGGLLLLLGAGGAGWATGAVATVVTTGAGLLRRNLAA